MGSSPWNGILPKYAVGQISKTARKLVGRYGFTRSDQEDIEEELAIAVWRRLPKYDPAEGEFEAFLYWLVKKARATLIERQVAKKRGGGSRPCSLDSTIRGADGAPASIAAVTQESEAGRRLGLGPEHFTERSDRAIEIARFLDGLPDDLRDLCLRLMEDPNLTRISRETCIPRGTLYERRRELRRLMEAAGLSEYLPRPGASERPPVGNQ